MRIGMDLSAVRHGLRNGIAVYTANLARALLRLGGVDLVAWYCARESAAAETVLEELETLGATVRRAPSPWRWSPDGGWWLPVRPPMAALLADVDVFHIGEFQLPPVPRSAGPAFVATVHDLTTVTHPEHHTWLNRVVHRRRLAWVRRHADRVIAVSGSTAGDLETEAGIEPERLAVVHEARGHSPEPGDPEPVRRRYGVGPRYVLTVGTLEPRKNHDRLVQAFEGLDDPDVELVVVGGAGWGAKGIQRVIDASPVRQRIRRLGAVPAADLAALYAGAAVFAYPSLYEGFGLPVLEAMAAGTPVLTSDLSSLPEVAGDAGVLVDPVSVEAIRAGLARLLGDAALRTRLIDAGRRREQAFTWDRAARETLAVYHEAMENPEPTAP